MQDRVGAAAEGYHGGYRRSRDWVGHLLLHSLYSSASAKLQKYTIAKKVGFEYRQVMFWNSL
jgi:hypothetical protein